MCPTPEEHCGTINALDSGLGREAYPMVRELINMNVIMNKEWYDEHGDG